MKHRYAPLLILLLFICCLVMSRAQTSQPQLDSLIAAVATMPDDTAKVKSIINIANQYRASRDKELTMQYANKALALSEDLKYHPGQGASNSIIGAVYANENNFDQAIVFFERALSFHLKADRLSHAAWQHQNLSICHKSLGDFQKATDHAMAALQIWESIGNKLNAGNALMETGLMYAMQNQTRTAVELWIRSLHIFEEIGNKKQMAGIYNNLSTAHSSLGELDLALQCGEQALSIAEEINYTEIISNASTNIGIIYSKRGEPKKAVIYYEKALKISEQMGDKRGQAYALKNLAADHSNSGNMEKGYEYSFKALDLFEELGDNREVARMLNNIGANYRSQALYDEALEMLSKAKSITVEIDDRNEFARSCREIGIIQQERGDFLAAEENFLTAIKIFEEYENLDGLYKGHLSLGVNYKELGRPQDAIRSYQTALRICEEAGFKPAMGDVLQNIANVYEHLGMYPKALEYTLDAIKIKEEVGSKSGIGASYQVIGSILVKQNNLEEALKNYFKSLEYFEQTGEKQFASVTYYNIGEVYAEQGKYEEGIQILLKALKINEDIGHTEGMGDVHMALGKIYARQNHFNEALEHLLIATRKYEGIGLKAGMTDAYANTGKTLNQRAASEPSIQAQQTYDEALKFLGKSRDIALETSRAEALQLSYQGLADAYAGLQDYENALLYQSQYITLKDSLLNNITTRQLEQLRTQYEVEKAVTSEKAKQDSLLAEQKFASEKEQAEIEARHVLAIAEAKAEEEKAIAVARVRYQMSLDVARTEQERELAEQQFQSELKIAEENARHRLELAEEKAKQEQKEAEQRQTAEREREERKRRNEAILTGLAILGIISLFVILLLRQRNLKRRAIEKADTVRKMAELELQSLRAQLNPHFMFNSLNAIQELILLEDNDRSHMYLARFAKLLRMLLENANSPFIPLARELEFLELYLSLENLRIPDLKYNIHVDPAIHPEQIRIPNMILQPYIENAIWHGLSHKKTGERKIEISVSSQPDCVTYEIEDNGVGRKKSAELKSLYRKEHKSKGMELLSKRFKLLNEEYRYQVDTQITDVLQNDQEAGTLVTISVPSGLSREMRRAS